jgi:hypothetical protein
VRHRRRSRWDEFAAGVSITGAKKDLNCKGRGPQWYRMVWRPGSWQYVSSDRLPAGNFLASDRRASVSGEVYHGEIVVLLAFDTSNVESGSVFLQFALVSEAQDLVPLSSKLSVVAS